MEKHNNDSIEKKYRFSEMGHIHWLGDKRLTGITTVLQVISKGDALTQWSANEAVKYIDEVFEKQLAEQPVESDFLLFLADNWKQIMEEAKVAHKKKKEDAGQAGTDVHAIIEQIIKKAIKENGGFIGMNVYDNPQIQHFMDWQFNNKVKFLDCELHLYSEVHFLGGICDFVCEMNNEVWIGDIKTGAGIYSEHFFQTAGYQIMLEERGLYPNIKGHIILNLKKDGSFAEKRSVSNEDNKQAFLSALTLYRIKSKIEGNLI
jgi:hypothetical protein